MAATLKVPLAHDEARNLVTIQIADPGKQYFCPLCGVSLIQKRGTVRVPHFAHKASETCNLETITHKTAKLLVQQAITNWKAGSVNAPIVRRSCQVCEQVFDQALPDKVERASVEYRLPDGFIADVALMVGETAEAAIEIRVTHAVDELKAEQISIPFIELDGFAIVDNPAIWKPIVDRFKPLTCATCLQTFRPFQERTVNIAKRSSVWLPDEYFRYAPHTCWRCKKEILVFTWPNHVLFDDNSPKHLTIPRTIRFEYSKTAEGKYWANTCPYCHVIQGDFPLYMEPDSPFFGFDCGEDTPEDFHRDLMVLAHLVERNQSA